MSFFQGIVFGRQVIGRCGARRLSAALGVVCTGQAKLILGRFLGRYRLFFLGGADLTGCLTASLGRRRRRDRDSEPAAVFVEVGVLGGNDATRISRCHGPRRVLVRNADDLARAQTVHVVGHKRFLIRAEQRHEHLLQANALNSVSDSNLRERVTAYDLVDIRNPELLDQLGGRRGSKRRVHLNGHGFGRIHFSRQYLNLRRSRRRRFPGRFLRRRSGLRRRYLSGRNRLRRSARRRRNRLRE